RGSCKSVPDPGDAVVDTRGGNDGATVPGLSAILNRFATGDLVAYEVTLVGGRHGMPCAPSVATTTGEIRFFSMSTLGFRGSAEPLTIRKLKHIHWLVGEGPLPVQPADHGIDIWRGRAQLFELAFAEDEAGPFTNGSDLLAACLRDIGAGRRGN